MDWDSCNHKKLNEFTSEARRWKAADKEAKPKAEVKGQRTQPQKRKRKAKK